ncbi:MAG: ABC transporter substrate-binding protein [Anaerolineales bacterium]
MNRKFNTLALPTLIVILVVLVCACSSPSTPESVVETLVVTQTVQAPPVEVVKFATPTPEPAGERTLTICSNQAPDTLFVYGTSVYVREMDLIYDGPVDTRSYSNQPVILEKIPNLADGDASINQVVVSEGDSVMDASGSIVFLDPAADPPIMLIPTGGGEPVAYHGGEIRMDQLSATFTLLPNLTWSDGTPLTASDSVYSFNLLEEPNFLNLDFFLKTASYEAIDERTTVWTGVPGFMDGNYFSNFVLPLPEHVLGQYPPADLPTAQEAALTPLGWGPYRITEHSLGEQIILEKNPFYFRANEGLPGFDQLIFKYILDNPDALISALLAGECDLALGIDNEYIEFMLELHKSSLVSTIISDSSFFEVLTIIIQPRSYDDGYQVGVERPDFFSDVRTRQAIALCLDRQRAADLDTFGTSKVLDTYFPDYHPLFTDQVAHYEHNPQAGSDLLEEVGWIDHDNDPETARIAQGVENVLDGTTFEFSYQTTNDREQIATILEQSLRECGIHARLTTKSRADFFQPEPSGGNFFRNGDLFEWAWFTEPQSPCDLYVSAAVPGPVGESWVSIMDGKERTFTTTSGYNINGFADQEYDTACETALNKLPGQAGYVDAHHQAQLLYSQMLPSIPIFSRIYFISTRPDMCNVILDPTDTELWNIEEFDYGDGCVE